MRLLSRSNRAEMLPTPTSCSPEDAARIMGLNYLGLMSSVRLHYGFNPERGTGYQITDSDQALLSTVPFSQELLRKRLTTHMLVATIGMSIMDLHGHLTDMFYPAYSNRPWFWDEAFANAKPPTSWHLLRIRPVPGTPRQIREQQLQRLAENERLPDTATALYAYLLHFMATRQFPNRGLCLRTAGTDSQGRNLQVSMNGGYCGLPFEIHVYSDERGAFPGTGLASELKSTAS